MSAERIIPKTIFLLLFAAILSRGASAQTKQDSAPCKAANPGPASMELARAMKTSAHDIDTSLPSQCIADWLTAILETNDFAWSISDCEKAADVKQQAKPNAPKCLLAEGITTNTVTLRVRIQVGTAEKWNSGKPTLHSAILSGCGRSKEVAALGELRTALQYVNEGCKK
jgi:hypothetical protein